MANYKYKLNEMSKKASAEDAEKELGIPKSKFEVGQVSFSDDGTSKSTITNIDDTTGAISWKIEQLPGFDKLYQEVDQFVDAAKRVFQKTKDDKKFIEIYDDARKVKNKLRTHLRNNYTDIYKRLQMRGIAEEEVEEISTSGGAGSYLGKYAFKKPKKKKLNEAIDGGQLFDYFNKKYIVDDHFHSDDSYIVKREPSGKDQYVIFDYDKDKDQFQIRQLGGYQIDRSEAMKAGMKETSKLARVGMDAYMVDGNYSPTPISIKGLKDIVDHVMGGLSREADAQQSYYARRGPTSGTIDESPKNPGATLGPGPKAGEDGVKDNYYVKAFGYKLAPSVKNRKSKVIDYRQLWKENHTYNQTLSEAENDVEQFQQKRINDFDELEKRLDVLQKKLKQGKLSTIRYYREQPKSYSVVYGTDMINDYFNDIETLLTQDN